MNPFFQAVDWLIGRIEEIPTVALRSGVVTGVEPLKVQLPGEDPAPMRRLGPAPLDASGMVLSVGPARVWLGSLDQDPTVSTDVDWTPLTLDPGFSGTPKWCRRDGVIYLFGRVTRDAGAWPDALTKVATMPAAARPAQMLYTSGMSRFGHPLSVAVDDRLIVKSESATAEVQLESIPPYLVTAGS